MKREQKQIFKFIDEGDLQSIQDILSANPELIEAIGDNDAFCLHKTPLMYAIQCLQVEIADWLLDAGANVDFQMPTGLKTPALSLCVDPLIPIELLEKMLALGSNPNRYDHLGNTVAYVAVGFCATSMEKNGLRKVRLLAEHGADFDFAPIPDEPDIDPMSAREYAKSLEDLPPGVAQFLGIRQHASNQLDKTETKDVVFEYPDGELDDYRAALEHGFKIIFDTITQDWIFVEVQGGTESSIVFETLPIKARRFLFEFEKFNQKKQAKSYPSWFSKIEKDADGFCLLPTDVTPQQLAELVDYICTKITKLPKFQGDYAIGFEYWPDFDYEAFKQSTNAEE